MMTTKAKGRKSKRKRKHIFDPLKTTLVLGSLAATLVGANLVSGQEWLTSVSAQRSAVMAFPIPDKSQLEAIPTVATASSPPDMVPPSVPSASEALPTVVLEPIPTAMAANAATAPTIVIEDVTASFAMEAIPTVAAVTLPSANVPNIANIGHVPNITTISTSPNIPTLPTLPTLPSGPSLPAANSGSTVSAGTIELPPLPAVVVPNIGNLPTVGNTGSGISLDLAPIPEVAVPQPVTSTRSSR